MTATTTPPLDEASRQRALDRYHVLDSLPEAAFNDIVQLAATLCGTPTALISLIDHDRQWFKARTGFDGSQTERSVAVCDHAIRNPDQLLEVEDLSRDARFADNPLVDGRQGDARFYAGMPLVTDEGAAIGTVCVIDGTPRHLDDAQRAALQSLARLTMALLDARARERVLEHTAFVATTAPSTPAADAGTGSDAPGYLLALIELQDLAGTIARLGERTTERLLQDLDATLEQTLSSDNGDALSRSSGSGEYVAVLHGDAAATLTRLRGVLGHASDAHGLQFVIGSTQGTASEHTGLVFLRAETDLLDRKAAGAAH